MNPDRWRQIEAVCQQALARAPDERGAFLDKACKDDAELRREVESLMAEESGAGEFLETPAAAVRLSSGTRLGPYEITAFVGAGGMGEVYQARDTRLGRTVAIKVLPPDLAADPERRRRFEHEARAVSALNHPHICTLHDIGRLRAEGASAGQGGEVEFLVLEHLEGETLAARLRKGPLPLAQALDYGAEIADALSAAHRHGIVHRDLKPANIMLTKAGAKLLDFGLAKLKAGSGLSALGSGVEGGSGAMTPEPLTNRNVIVGTLPYMAPEQLERREADARTDIWALGAILYEMLTAKRAFAGDSEASIVSAVMTATPPSITSLQPATPPVLDRVVRRCLERDPDERWQDARDLVAELKWLDELGPDAGGASTAAAGRAESRSRRRERLAWLVASLALVAVVSVALWREPAAPPASMRLTIALPPDMPLAPAGRVSPAEDKPALALSPDGGRLVYVALVEDATRLAVRDMRTGQVNLLDDTAGGHTPFFSPDGAWIGFFAGGKLKKIPSGGGGPTVLADAPNPWGAVWGRDNLIYFIRFEGEGVFRVDPDGGPVEHVIKEPALMPSWGPGRGLLAFGGGYSGTRYVEPHNPAAARLIVDGNGARYLASGHLLYWSSGKLMAEPFDATRLAATGSAVTLVDNLRTASYGVAQFTVSDNGTLVYVPGKPQGLASFVWVDREGGTQSFGLPEDDYDSFALSPDACCVAFSLFGEIYVYDRSRDTTRRVTPRVTSGNPVRNKYPQWTPDGASILYYSWQLDSQARLMLASTDGSTQPRELWTVRETGPFRLLPMNFSPDRSVLSVFGPSRGTSYDLFLMRAGQPGSPEPLMRTDQGSWLTGWSEPELFLGSTFSEGMGQISPDGRWMLFGSDRSGAYEIYVTSYPTPGPIYQVSRGGGREPMWNPAAPEIVYVSGSAMYSVAVTLEPPFRSGEPRLLFEGAYPDTNGLGFGIARDGQHFLMLENKDFLKPTTTLTVITNLFEELRRLAPASRE